MECLWVGVYYTGLDSLDIAKHTFSLAFAERLKPLHMCEQNEPPRSKGLLVTLTFAADNAAARSGFNEAFEVESQVKRKNSPARQ